MTGHEDVAVKLRKSEGIEKLSTSSSASRKTALVRARQVGRKPLSALLHGMLEVTKTLTLPNLKSLRIHLFAHAETCHSFVANPYGFQAYVSARNRPTSFLTTTGIYYCTCEYHRNLNSQPLCHRVVHRIEICNGPIFSSVLTHLVPISSSRRLIAGYYCRTILTRMGRTGMQSARILSMPIN